MERIEQHACFIVLLSPSPRAVGGMYLVEYKVRPFYSICKIFLFISCSLIDKFLSLFGGII